MDPSRLSRSSAGIGTHSGQPALIPATGSTVWMMPLILIILALTVFGQIASPARAPECARFSGRRVGNRMSMLVYSTAVDINMAGMILLIFAHT
jgi:hypothetical protein